MENAGLDAVTKKIDDVKESIQDTKKDMNDVKTGIENLKANIQNIENNIQSLNKSLEMLNNISRYRNVYIKEISNPRKSTYKGMQCTIFDAKFVPKFERNVYLLAGQVQNLDYPPIDNTNNYVSKAEVQVIEDGYVDLSLMYVVNGESKIVEGLGEELPLGMEYNFKASVKCAVYDAGYAEECPNPDIIFAELRRERAKENRTRYSLFGTKE